MPRLPAPILITCALCNKPVERLEKIHSMFQDVITYRVYCHGDIDNCELSGLDLMCIKPQDLATGIAFRTKRLPEPLRGLKYDTLKIDEI